MNKYVKEFFKRGLMFGGFGPIVVGFVMMLIGFSGQTIELEGYQWFIAIVSSYLLAFVQAGITVVEQIDEWPTIKSLLIHLATIYGIYLVTYLVNNWIPFNWLVIVIFSGAVIVGFLLIWGITAYIVNKTTKRLNQSLAK